MVTYQTQREDPLLDQAPALSGCAPFMRIVHDCRTGPRFVLKTRRIRDHAFLYVRRGVGELTSGRARQLLGPGSLIMVPPGPDHAFDLSDAEGVQMFNCHFDPVWQADSALVEHQFDPQRPDRRSPMPGGLFASRVIVHQVGIPAAYEARFLAMARRFPAIDAMGALELRAAAIEHIAWTLRDLSGRTVIEDDDTALQRARRRLDEAPGPIGLAELEKVAGMGRTRLCAAFRRRFGLSPIDYQRHSRIERAKADLVSADLPVKAVAARGGFASIHHFTKVFTRLVGEPPAAYQRRINRR